MEAITGAFVWKWFRCLFLSRHLFQDAFVWFQLFCSAVYFTWLVVLLIQFSSFMWYFWFRLVFFFSSSLAEIFTVSGAVPINCGSDKTVLGHFCYRALLGKALCHRMAQQ